LEHAKAPAVERSKEGLYYNTDPLSIDSTPGLWRTPIIEVISLQSLSSLLGKIEDPRKGKITYSLETILSTAFATVLFRCESKNAFFNAATADSKSKSSIGQFCQTIAGCDGKELPNSKTVDDVLVKLNLNSMNDLLLNQFEQFRLSKVWNKCI